MQKLKTLIFLYCLPISLFSAERSWIRINQLGYLEESIKIAVLVSKEDFTLSQFEVCNALTDKVELQSKNINKFGEWGAFKSSYRLNFSELKKSGAYYIKAGNIKSPVFRISDDIYNGAADFLLNYMRQQRCGYNPFLKDSCHTRDGFIIYHPTLDSTYIDVKGGWHDASDYLQYVTTSANATLQMLFAYQQNPNSFGDYFDANSDAGSNEIPDILDEAKWGVDWLLRMNPEKDFMFNQIADDRDHMGFRLPTEDTINYGKPRQKNQRFAERPVYFINGQPQGVLKHKNRTTGVASTAAKYASAFALASQLLNDYYPELTDVLIQKSIDAYEFAQEFPGVCQTAPCRAPYFYEEDNWVDDVQLASVLVHKVNKVHKVCKVHKACTESANADECVHKVESGDKENVVDEYFHKAIEFGRGEKVTPWMGADTARHYQWYPFINLGHYYLASSKDKKISKEFISYIKDGLEKIFQRGKANPFQFGIPFIWCSNNLVAAAMTQARLYHQLTGDTRYLEMEASLRDWLFGCNPWGTSMIVGFPKFGDYPIDPHSAFTHVYNYPIDGGLVDGPVYGSIFNNLIGIKLYNDDEYSEFQSDLVVYHDDWGDYSTNEPTMDGTASLTYYFSALEKLGSSKTKQKKFEKSHGGIIQGDKTEKEIYLVFTGHEFADGGESILETLKKHNVIASFFFTGDFYRNENFKGLIGEIKKDGHYLGAHSDKHLLYCDWINRDSLLISKQEFFEDIKNNYKEMEKFGINPSDAKFFIPPFEWYNEKIVEWCDELGITLVNFTRGTYSNADYTLPEMKNYLSSEEIYNRILNFDSTNPSRLNGVILLIHVGSDPKRIDKFYHKLDDLIRNLKDNSYNFVSMSTLN
ncbi:MAG: cellulase [Ignavibacteria bacterium]|nr:cellulase [Ignavibacteria bacterium]